MDIVGKWRHISHYERFIVEVFLIKRNLLSYTDGVVLSN